MEMFMTIHLSQQAAELWAGQLINNGMLVEIKGPLSRIAIANHTLAPAQDSLVMNHGPFWLVTTSVKP